MPRKHILLEEFHLTIFMPRGLSERAGLRLSSISGCAQEQREPHPASVKDARVVDSKM